MPVIGSLNGVTPSGWVDYARAMQDAGAAAIELNIYYLPGDPQHLGPRGRAAPRRHPARVKEAVTVPVAVKLSPYFSSTGEIALRLDEAGADALVLFNRFLQPDIDPEHARRRCAQVGLSSPAEARLPRTWIALLRGRVRASLAATTGVETPDDVAKYLLAGADVVMTASALLRHGPEHAAVLLDGLTEWMERKGFADVDEVRGLLAVPPGTDEDSLRAVGLRHRDPRREQRPLRAGGPDGRRQLPLVPLAGRGPQHARGAEHLPVCVECADGHGLRLPVECDRRLEPRPRVLAGRLRGARVGAGEELPALDPRRAVPACVHRLPGDRDRGACRRPPRPTRSEAR